MKTRPLVVIILGVIACLSTLYWASNRAVTKPEQVAQDAVSPAAAAPLSSPLNPASEPPRTKSANRPPNSLRTGKLDDDFNVASYQLRPLADGGDAPNNAAIAYVQIPSTNRRAAILPNPYGEYEAQPTLTGETVGVRLRIEDVPPGTPVSVVILDGGSFPDGSGPAKIIKLGRDALLSFRFITSENIGHHRIRVLPSGGTARVFEFTASDS